MISFLAGYAYQQAKKHMAGFTGHVLAAAARVREDWSGFSGASEN